MPDETNGGGLAEYSVMDFGDLARQKMILDGSRYYVSCCTYYPQP